jgi:hypothetical protein
MTGTFTLGQRNVWPSKSLPTRSVVLRTLSERGYKREFDNFLEDHKQRTLASGKQSEIALIYC